MRRSIQVIWSKWSKYTLPITVRLHFLGHKTCIYMQAFLFFFNHFDLWLTSAAAASKLDNLLFQSVIHSSAVFGVLQKRMMMTGVRAWKRKAGWHQVGSSREAQPADTPPTQHLGHLNQDSSSLWPPSQNLQPYFVPVGSQKVEAAHQGYFGKRWWWRVGVYGDWLPAPPLVHTRAENNLLYHKMCGIKIASLHPLCLPGLNLTVQICALALFFSSEK